MKKYLLIIVTTIAFSGIIKAQDSLMVNAQDTVKYWSKGAVFNIAISQVALRNWAAGGQNSLSATGLFKANANYKKNDITWDNDLILEFGVLQQGKKSKFIKNTDRIDITTKAGRYAFKKYWFYSALLNIKTQMAPGYSDPITQKELISDFAAPAYGILAIGLNYKRNWDSEEKGKHNLDVLISPLAGKFTYVNVTSLANAGAYGLTASALDSGGNAISNSNKLRVELGGYLNVKYEKDLTKNIRFNTKLELFNNYLVKDFYKYTDVNSETSISMQINKYLTTTIGTTLIYDNDIMIKVDDNEDGVIDAIGPRLQFKEILNLGFVYKF